MQNNKRIMLASAALAALPAQAVDADIEIEFGDDGPVDIYDYKQQPALSKKSQRKTHPTSWRK